MKDYLLVVVLELADGGEHWEDRCETFASEADAERGAKTLARYVRSQHPNSKVVECYAQEEPS